MPGIGTTKQVSTPNTVIRERKITRKPMQVVVVYIESLLSINPPLRRNVRMENPPIFQGSAASATQLPL